MSSQAQEVLEGEAAGPRYGSSGAADNREDQGLVNGPSAPRTAVASYGYAETARDGQQDCGAASVSELEARESAQDIQDAQGMHHAPAHTQQQHQQQPVASSSLPETANASLRQEQSLSDPPPRPIPEPLRPDQYIQTLSPARPQLLQPQVIESTQSVTMRVETSPPEELPGQEDLRGNQSVWMVRLGEFFQRRVNQAAAVVAPVLERPNRGALTRPFMTPPSSWTAPSPRTQAAPLFDAEATRTMQQWPQQAPLLHGRGANTGGPRDTESSSGSLTQEQILAEVRRQVREAMGAHQLEMSSLRKENAHLRAELERCDRALSQPPTGLLHLRGGNPVGHQGGGDHPDDGAPREDPVGPPRAPGGLRGEVGELREGGYVTGPPPGLQRNIQASDFVGYHGSDAVRGGDHAEPKEA